MLRATLFLAALTASLTYADQVVYSTGFEALEGYTNGTLSGQQGWFNATNVAVQGTTFQSGSQAVSMTSQGAGQFLTAQSFTYTPVRPNHVATVGTWFRYEAGTGVIAWNPLAVFGDNGFLGQIFVRGGNAALGLGSGSVGSVAVADGTWNYFRFVFDFGTTTKSAYVNSTLIASLPFGNTGTRLTDVAIGQNSAAAGNSGNSAAWDNVSVMATPEPGSLGFMAVGFGALAFAGWRKRSRQ